MLSCYTAATLLITIILLSLLQGYFFNHEESAPGLASRAQEETLADETASLGLIPETKFHPIHTTWIALLQLILFVSMKYFWCFIILHVHVLYMLRQYSSKHDYNLSFHCMHYNVLGIFIQGDRHVSLRKAEKNFNSNCYEVSTNFLVLNL